MAATITDANKAALKVFEDNGNGTGALHVISDSGALPTGAATAARQDTGNTSLASIVTALTTLLSQTDGLEASVDGIETLLAPLTNFGAGEYETVAASQAAQVLGAAGAIGDYISGILVIPANLNPGNVILLDNAISITLFAGGTASVSTLIPFFIPLGLKSVSGALKITTGADVSVIAIGAFT